MQIQTNDPNRLDNTMNENKKTMTSSSLKDEEALALEISPSSLYETMREDTPEKIKSNDTNGMTHDQELFTELDDYNTRYTYIKY